MPLHKPQSYKPIQHLKGPSYRRRKRLGRKKASVCCDRDVFDNGELVLFTYGPAVRIDTWVNMIRERSGQRVDWHYAGGRARVLALGDIDKVLEAIRKYPYVPPSI